MDQLPVLELEERARCVDSELRRIFKENAEHSDQKFRFNYVHRKGLPVAEFFRAALLIRQNYSEWVQLVASPKKSNGVLAPITDNATLMFCLHLYDSLKVIHLNPELDFITTRKDAKCNHLICEPNQFKREYTQERFTEYFGHAIDTWVSWKEPQVFSESITNWLSASVAALKDNSVLTTPESVFHVIDIEAHKAFGLPFFVHKHRRYYEWKLLPSFFSRAFSIHITFEVPSTTPESLLEVVVRLFPQLPDLAPCIIQYYRFLSLSKLSSGETIPDNRLLMASRGDISAWFGCDVTFDNVNHNSPLVHQAALSVIRKHPELFITWSRNSDMKRLYGLLVIPALQARRSRPPRESLS